MKLVAFATAAAVIGVFSIPTGGLFLIGLGVGLIAGRLVGAHGRI